MNFLVLEGMGGRVRIRVRVMVIVDVVRVEIVFLVMYFNKVEIRDKICCVI